MGRLLAASLVWAFSFALIKDRLSEVDPTLAAFLRIALTLPVFLPLLWWRPVRLGLGAKGGLASIGAVQFGLMYLALFPAFQYLSGFEVAAYTVTTPLYVSLLAAMDERRWPSRRLFIAVLLSFVGAVVIRWEGWSNLDPELIRGFLLVQTSNLCFAAGQIAYRRAQRRIGWETDTSVFGWLYLGAFTCLLVASLVQIKAPLAALRSLDGSEWLTLIYLGLVASGLGFFLWNSGATRTTATILAVFNNLKIPLAILVAALFFGEVVPWLRVVAGGALIALALTLAWRGSMSRKRDTSS